MSRSNPTSHQANPSTRWHEWDGSNGAIRYYDKEKKENIVLKLPFVFLVLDELYRASGWSERNKCGITSNEIRDIVADPMVVKAHKGGVIAAGVWKDIKPIVTVAGGHFEENIYIGYRPAGGKELKVGSLCLKGAALNAWVEFRKANRNALLTKAIKITGFTKGKKGKIEFCVPTFALLDVTEATNEEAKALDLQLQEYLKGYFSRPKSDHPATPPSGAVPDEHYQHDAPPDDPGDVPAGTEGEPPAESEDVPF